MSNLIPFEQQTSLARAFVQSKLFGVQNESQALALMALCEAEGLHPAKAVQEYHIIHGDRSLMRIQKLDELDLLALTIEALAK